VSYDVVGLLGRGGSAVVELAIDGNGRPVATKRVALTGSATQMQVARQRLRREAEILGRLAHPGIVPVIDIIDDGSEIVLVFPAMAENLEDRVGRLGPLAPSEVARIGRVLIEALAVAHRHGVVHRDIKPANVLFDHAGGPALADFGVAVTSEVTAGLTQAGTVVGTPMWMAPEQARGEPAGPAGDVFSLAATLAFAATGQGPYAPGPAPAVMRQAARNEIRPVTDAVPDVLRAPLTRMLAPRPERRPSAAAVLGGLDGTTVAPAVRSRRGALRSRLARHSRHARHSRLAQHPRLARLLAWPAGLLGDPDRQPDPPSRRRRVATVLAGLAAVALVGAVVAVALVPGGGTRPRIRSPPVAAPAPSPVCTPLPYQACGASGPAPHTTGTTCEPGWYDLDGIAADGCEARSDYVAGLALTADVARHANLVPASALDSFSTHVSGDAFRFCWGSLRVTLTAPAHTAEELTLWKGTTKLADALSADGTPATATVAKPSCFGADSEDLRATVAAVAATGGASAADFTLTRNGGW
jgi:hypothetical protein